MYFCSPRSHFRSIKNSSAHMCGIFFLIFQICQFFRHFQSDFNKLQIKIKIWFFRIIFNKDNQSEVIWICLRTIWLKGPLEMPWVAVFCVSNTPVQTFGSKSEGQPCIKSPQFQDPFHPRKPNKNSFWQPCKSKLRVSKQSTSKLYYEKFILSKEEETAKEENNQWVIMDTIGIYEYNSKDLIGHGAFAVVYKGRVKMVSHKRVNIYFGYRNSCSEHWMFRVSEKVEQWTLLIPLATCKVSWQIHSHPKYDFGLDSFCLPDIYFAFSILLH